ncbi:MAG: hypothetical protein M1358_08600, partial [Chloroflexi bacterium]|nr:hypothetical protein [Chloroflexota bacterium]
GRKLVFRANHRWPFLEERVARQVAIQSESLIAANRIGAALPDVVRQLTLPLYQAFDFFVPPTEMFEQELGRMRKGV